MYMIFVFHLYFNKAKKKPTSKTVSKPWKDQTELFEYEEAAPSDCSVFTILIYIMFAIYLIMIYY